MKNRSFHTFVAKRDIAPTHWSLVFFIVLTLLLFSVRDSLAENKSVTVAEVDHITILEEDIEARAHALLASIDEEKEGLPYRALFVSILRRAVDDVLLSLAASDGALTQQEGRAIARGAQDALTNPKVRALLETHADSRAESPRLPDTQTPAGIHERRIEVLYLAAPKDASTEEQLSLHERARNIRARVKGGRLDFRTAVTLYTDAPHRAKGKISRWVSRQALPEALADVAFTIPLNTVSDVIETRRGVAILLAKEERFVSAEVILPTAVAEATRRSTLARSQQFAAILDGLRKKHKVILYRE